MRKILTMLISIVCISIVHAQNPLVKEWDYRFGGTSQDYIFTLQSTLDGGCIMGGFSVSSASGVKTQDSWGGYDYWVVKIDSVGTKQWDRDFGGTEDERLYTLQQTKDGGYILGGSSSSGISGDKSEPNWDDMNGSHDYWIVKIDSLGNKQWDKTFGGIANDLLISVRQTKDGGYILGGYSLSGISGDKTESNWDSISYTNDFWVVKIDSLGNKEWDKDFGGTGEDELISIRQVDDGGYFLAGLSLSGISGNKTQDSQGLIDYWIIKIDSAGSVEWDKDFGGSLNDILYSMQYTKDGGCIMAGVSNSGISGDKSQPNWDNSNSTNDYWLVKIDSLGNKEWDKVLGGTVSEPRFGNVSQTSDGGYLAAGISYSQISGNKTENNLGIEQTWVVKTDSLGTVQWDKTIYTTAEDENGYAVQAKGGCYFMANNTHADVGGYLTQSGYGVEDYWILKFCDTSIATINKPPFRFADKLSVYPNPFSSEVNLVTGKQTAGNISVAIYDVLGQAIFSTEEKQTAGISTRTIDMHLIPKGIYFLEVNTDLEKRVLKIVKE